MSKSVILVCVHKRDAFLSTPPYMPVQAGKAAASIDLGIAGDDTGDNISRKNPNFCELTVHYWAWKNHIEADYVGLCHYRRYFDFGRSFCCVRTETTDSFFGRPHDVPDLDGIFSRYDIVMPTPKVYQYNLYHDYSRCHRSSDIDVLRQVVAERHPHCLKAFDDFFFRNNRLPHFNMFVMPRKRFEHYSQWLFDILFEVARRVDIPDDAVQGRIFGYMSERLLSVYVRAEGLRVYSRTVTMVDDRKRKGLASNLFHYVVNTLLYAVTLPFYRRRPRKV